MLLLSMCAASGVAGMAQEPQLQEEEQDPRDIRRAAPPRMANSVGNGILMGMRNRWGCSVSAFGAYSSNLFASSGAGQKGRIISLLPRIFANFEGRRTRLHADYGYGYRFYRGNKDLNRGEHYLNLDYNVRLSRRFMFLVYERYALATNDAYSLFQPGFSPILGDTQPSYYSYPGEYLRGRQLVSRNDSAAALGFQVSRDGNLVVTTGYQAYRYYRSEFSGRQSAAYGALGYSHRLAKWLTLSSTYTAYFADASSDFRELQIQRVQVGNFSFDLSRSWRLYVAGGLDYSSGNRGSGSRTTGSADAGIVHGTRTNSLALFYRRGFVTVFGRPGLYTADSGTLAFVQRVAPRISFQGSGYYLRGSRGDSVGRVEVYGGLAGFDFGLRRDLVFNVNYSYRYQTATGASDRWDFDRYTVYGGLVYFWPVRQ